MTFLELPLASPADSADVTILGVPRAVDYPGTDAACADGPAAIRRRSQRLAAFLEHHDFDVDGPMLPVGLRVVDGGDAEGAVAEEAAVRSILASRGVPVIVGGDDSVPIPLLRAYDTPIAVLQVDAHLDFRDEVDGVRDGYSSSMRRASEMEHVQRIVQVGLRGVGTARPSDVADARAAGNVLVTAAELRGRGADWAAATELASGVPVVLCFDLDGLDPSVAPGVRAPAPGGLTYAEASDLMAAIARRAPIVGAAFTEYAPALDVNEVTALVAVRLVTQLIAAVGSSR